MGVGVDVPADAHPGRRPLSADDRFAAFYRAAYPWAKRLAHLLLGGSADAEDVVQDAFAHVHARYTSVLVPEAYLRTSVVNGCRQLHRGRAREDRRIRLVADHGERVDRRPRPAARRGRHAAAVAACGGRAALLGRPARRRDRRGDRRASGDRAVARPSRPRVPAQGDRPMLTDLERDLRDAFAREAADVDLPAPEWAGARPSAAPRRSRRLVAVAAAAVAAAGIGSLWLGRSSVDLAPADQPETTVPAGVEMQLQPVLVGDLRWAPAPFVVGAVRPGSFHSYAVDGQQFVVFETIEHRAVPVSSRFVASRTRQRRLGAARSGSVRWPSPLLPRGLDGPARRYRLRHRSDGRRSEVATPRRRRRRVPRSCVVAGTRQRRSRARPARPGAGVARRLRRRAPRVSSTTRSVGTARRRSPWRRSPPRCAAWTTTTSPPTPATRCASTRRSSTCGTSASHVADAAGTRRFMELGGRVVSDPADDPTWSEEAWRGETSRSRASSHRAAARPAGSTSRCRHRRVTGHCDWLVLARSSSVALRPDGGHRQQ